MGGYLIGCDIGTGGTKAVVMDTKGKVLGSHYVEYALIIPRAGWAEHEPDQYWRAVAETIRVSIDKSRVNSQKILGVGLSALSPACILVDKDLNPLQNAHIWMDRRAIKESQWLKENIGEKRIFEVSANPIDPYYGVTKLMWEKNNRPELYKKAYKMLNAKDYPLMKLTGKAVTDYSNASTDGIVFDIRKKKWDEDLVKEIGLDVGKLPDLYPCDKVVGKVGKEAARITGLVEGTPVVAGTVDGSATWLSTGVIEDGENSLFIGTAACWGVAHDEPVFTPGMLSLAHAAYSNRKYLTAAVSIGGGVYRWVRDNFAQIEYFTGKKLGVDTYDIMNLEAERISRGSDGLIILPYFMGERTPIWDPESRGVMFGLSFAHTRGHLMRAIMEAIGFGVRQNIELVKNQGRKVLSRMGIAEGGAKSRLWRQIISDIVGVDTIYMGKVQGAPVGDALVAGVGVGVFGRYEIIKDWLEISMHHLPDSKAHEFYTKLFKIYLELYPTLKESFHNLAKICEEKGK